jgi:hypothetical protein
MTLDSKQLIEKFKRADVTLRCGEEFDIVVEYSVKVANCGNPTQAEQDQMFNGLKREYNMKAQYQCDSMGTACPFPTATDTKELTNSCDNNLWTVKLKVTTRCTS